MSSWEIVILVLMSVCFLSTVVLIISAVKALRREDNGYNEYRDHTFTHTFRTADPFWHMDDRGAHIEMVDGQLWYWSDRADHNDGIST